MSICWGEDFGVSAGPEQTFQGGLCRVGVDPVVARGTDLDGEAERSFSATCGVMPFKAFLRARSSAVGTKGRSRYFRISLVVVGFKKAPR